MRTPVIPTAILFLLAASGGLAQAEETSRAVICSIIDRAAARHALPPSFLTRLIWRESSFRPGARSHIGAQGIAQFMPATANERGLEDPFDPEAAIPASASYLSELRSRFGSLDLAAAAYNAGPARVAKWKSGQAGLPAETLAHVLFVTGVHLDLAQGTDPPEPTASPPDCLATLAAIRVAGGPRPHSDLADAIAPWGVQLVAGPSKARALEEYQTLQRRHGGILGAHRPTVITTRLGGRGQRSYYRIRIAFDERASADGLCRRMRKAGAPCLAVRN